MELKFVIRYFEEDLYLIPESFLKTFDRFVKFLDGLTREEWVIIYGDIVDNMFDKFDKEFKQYLIKGKNNDR